MADNGSTFADWAILELMGHRVLAGHVCEQEIAGASFLRIDIPGDGPQSPTTQFYSSSAVYCITPTTEETARAVARGRRPAPVQHWQIEPPRMSEGGDVDGEDITPYRPF